MLGLSFTVGSEPLTILCIGAHSDDIEIGVGGTILTLAAQERDCYVDWCVCSARGHRADEAHGSAAAFLKGAVDYRLELGHFDDSYFPAQYREIKEWLADVRSRATPPDIIFTHAHDDAHQDHRCVNEITRNLFRDQLILEYEIPKWDGDLSQRNFYVPLSEQVMERKIAMLLSHFGSQRSKDWFDGDSFKGLARIRGMECRAPERFAEAFTVRKALLSPM